MPQVIIDGKPFSFEGKPMLLQFCLDNGVEIPYFCYHPAMTIPTNCRMCLVEVGTPNRDRATGEILKDEKGEPIINWARKPNTACNTPVSPDMVVKTQKSSAKVKEMQAGVLEYMLVNHPLDCPICDQAGECPLQIWTYKYGPEGSRFESMKVHKPKRIELGPNVVLDAERCINCTRCVRFTEEISNTHQLSIVGRGENNFPSAGPGEVFDDPYSMCTIDICPVGALTSKAFRFNARVWEMAYSPGICTGCAKGCSTDVWVRDNKVMRLTPRENKEVNQFWMCDAGRLDIEKYNDNRVTGVSGRNEPLIDFETGLRSAARLMEEHEGKIFFLGSPQASVESNYAIRHLANKIGVKEIHYVPIIEEGWGDSLLRKDDRTPNAKACELLGFIPMTTEQLRSKIHHGDIHFLYMLEDEKSLEAIGEELGKIKSIVHATRKTSNISNANFVVPAATSIEADGVYINCDGKAQQSRMAKQVVQMTPEMWMRIPKSRNDKAAVSIDTWRDISNIQDVLPSWLLISKIAKYLGHDLGYKEHKEIFAKVKHDIIELKDFQVNYKVPKEAFKISQFEFAVK